MIFVTQCWKSMMTGKFKSNLEESKSQVQWSCFVSKNSTTLANLQLKKKNSREHGSDWQMKKLTKPWITVWLTPLKSQKIMLNSFLKMMKKHLQSEMIWLIFMVLFTLKQQTVVLNGSLKVINNASNPKITRTCQKLLVLYMPRVYLSTIINKKDMRKLQIN